MVIFEWSSSRVVEYVVRDRVAMWLVVPSVDGMYSSFGCTLSRLYRDYRLNVSYSDLTKKRETLASYFFT